MRLLFYVTSRHIYCIMHVIHIILCQIVVILNFVLFCPAAFYFVRVRLLISFLNGLVSTHLERTP
jgi:hypothetical protein